MFLSASPLQRNRWTEKVVTVKGLRVEIFDQREKYYPPLTVTKQGWQNKIFDCEKGVWGLPQSYIVPSMGAT